MEENQTGAVRTSAHFETLRPPIDRQGIPDREDVLIYIHIGKCGGESLWDAMVRSPVLNEAYSSVLRMHVVKPPVRSRTKYLVVVRNPIDRAISAFNWRYKLVVEDEVKSSRTSTEYAVLAKYKTLNALAEELYADGALDNDGADAFRAIHHLRENISFYLSELLPKVSATQISLVLATEFLDAEIARDLGVDRVRKEHQNRNSVNKEKLYLSDLARKNLRRFLDDDYEAVQMLFDMKGITGAKRDVVLR